MRSHIVNYLSIERNVCSEYFNELLRKLQVPDFNLSKLSKNR